MFCFYRGGILKNKRFLVIRTEKQAYGYYDDGTGEWDQRVCQGE